MSRQIVCFKTGNFCSSETTKADQKALGSVNSPIVIPCNNDKTDVKKLVLVNNSRNRKNR